MTDRELLDAAAKAAGHGVEFDDASGLVFMDTKFTGVLWNPLHNDGDALRLAVRLGLTVMETRHEKEGRRFARVIDTLAAGIHCELLGDDPYAATRRAIVRAAAAMA